MQIRQLVPFGWMVSLTMVGLVLLSGCHTTPRAEIPDQTRDNSSKSEEENQSDKDQNSIRNQQENRTVDSSSNTEQSDTSARGKNHQVDPIAYVSRGEKVQYDEVAAPSGKTIIMYTADWWPHCQRIEPQAEAFARNKDDMVLRLIDVSDARKKRLPVITQHKVMGTPHFVLLDSDGSILLEGKIKTWKKIQEGFK